MAGSRRNTRLATRILLGAFLLATPAAAETWMLFGRHGGCSSLPDAAERKPIFQGVATPEELRAKLDREGADFTYEEQTVVGQRIVTVTAKAHGIAIILVPKSVCNR
jgi:hypothetical protein